MYSRHVSYSLSGRRNNAAQAAWRAKLKKFEERNALARYVGGHMPDKFDGKRPSDFDGRLARYFALQPRPPTDKAGAQVIGNK
jgi:hypothetical protein